MRNRPGLPDLDHRWPGWRYWVARFLPETALTPVRIALVYAGIGLAALYVSDVVLVRLFSEPLLSRIQALKGGVEVILTAGFIFVLTTRRETQLRRTLRRLDQQREELDVLHRVLRHNLRNDLCLIHGYAERVHESASTETDDLQEACDAILETAERMTDYTEVASRIDKLSRRRGELRTYDLVENLPRILEEHPQVTDEIEVSTTLPEEVTVEVNPMFEDALREVIANAIEHNDSEPPRIELTVHSENEPTHFVEIRVADNGPGIPPSEYEPLEAGKEEPLLHISGLGLWFVKWTVDRSGGHLAFEDNASGGTTVRIQVPKSTELLVKSVLNSKLSFAR